MRGKRLRWLAAALAAFVVVLTACDKKNAPPHPPLEIDVGKGTVSYSLDELKAALPVVQVTVFNPSYSKNVTYDGFWLLDLLKFAGLTATQDQYDEIAFVCADGYAPTKPFAILESVKMLVAFQEAGGSFQEFLHGKTMTDPGPYYVVGTTKNSYAKFGWPYQVTKIEAVNFEQRYAGVYPRGAPKTGTVEKGFEIFRTQCLRCHSINLEGGELGPELNIPKNITEYQDEAYLRAFISNPGQFRARSKMPAFALPDSDIDAILAYLRYMKTLKREK